MMLHMTELTVYNGRFAALRYCAVTLGEQLVAPILMNRIMKLYAIRLIRVLPWAYNRLVGAAPLGINV